MKPAPLLALVLAAACGRAPQAPGGVMEYRAQDGLFTARIPGNWKVDEARHETAGAGFFGPPDGPKAFSQSIGVEYQAAQDPETEARESLEIESSLNSGPRPPRVAARYADPKKMPLEATVTQDIQDIHLGRRRVTTQMVAVPVPGGFFLLSSRRPAGDPPSAVFEEFRRSFKPGSAPK